MPNSTEIAAITITALMLTRRETAKLIGVSLSSFADLESRGLLGPQSVRIGDGRIVRYNRNEVQAWCEAGAPSRQRWLAMKTVLNARRVAG